MDPNDYDGLPGAVRDLVDALSTDVPAGVNVMHEMQKSLDALGSPAAALAAAASLDPSAYQDVDVTCPHCGSHAVDAALMYGGDVCGWCGAHFKARETFPSREDLAAAAESGARIVDGGVCSIGVRQPARIIPAPGVLPDAVSFDEGLRRWSEATTAAYAIAEAGGRRGVPMRAIDALVTAFGALAEPSTDRRNP